MGKSSAETGKSMYTVNHCMEEYMSELLISTITTTVYVSVLLNLRDAEERIRPFVS